MIFIKTCDITMIFTSSLDVWRWIRSFPGEIPLQKPIFMLKKMLRNDPVLYYIMCRFQLVSSSRTYLRPLSGVVSQNPQSSLVKQTQEQTRVTPVSLLPALRGFQTSAVSRDIDSAAKFIGAGAATVGVAGSG